MAHLVGALASTHAPSDEEIWWNASWSAWFAEEQLLETLDRLYLEWFERASGVPGRETGEAGVSGRKSLMNL